MKRIGLIRMLLASGLLVSATAHADSLTDCLSSGSGNVAGCYGAELSRLDGVVKEKYRKGLKAMLTDMSDNDTGLESVERLTKRYSEAQKLWEKYRESFCTDPAASGNAGLDALRCQVRVTAHRIRELNGED